MTVTEFQRRVAEALEPHSAALRDVLERVIGHEYPSEVASVDFEVFPEGFTDRFPVRAFFVDEFNTEFFLYRNGGAEYPSPVDPGLLDIPRVYPRELEAELAASDPEADAWSLAGRTLIEWFARCWVTAGGLQFELSAAISLHDDGDVFDLVEQRWGPKREAPASG